jgi:XTP/dITP diphosphohydrolase
MPDSKTLYVATKNAGKVRELRALFAGSGWQIQTYGEYADVVEGEVSYAENAALKATALRVQFARAGLAEYVLGDDSGLEVTALGRRPGVLSARYGGGDATWAERRALVRRELDGSASGDRSARFVCALHFIPVAGAAIAVECDVAGRISEADSGASGFSYDAAFYYPPLGKTFGDLSDVEKNRVSHRARAVAKLLETLTG